MGWLSFADLMTSAMLLSGLGLVKILGRRLLRAAKAPPPEMSVIISSLQQVYKDYPDTYELSALG
ncbi:unannotated protein [freshwater metagenome]|uniref:Unannotated protein n=1 Tax=freshwater metagenome TaxID=449393 RepID=A0A6J6N6C5_9ZZZZ